MIAGSAEDARAARAACTGRVQVVELPIDDSWLRDSGPIYVVDDAGGRVAVHFGFNAWGEKFAPWDKDAEIGGLIARELGDEVREAPMVLEGGSVISDGAGTILTTEQCLLAPNRNPSLSRDAIEELLAEYLGAERIVWLGQGLVEDRDTDGHVDLIAAFTPGPPRAGSDRAGRQPEPRELRGERCSVCTMPGSRRSRFRTFPTERSPASAWPSAT